MPAAIDPSEVARQTPACDTHHPGIAHPIARWLRPRTRYPCFGDNTATVRYFLAPERAGALVLSQTDSRLSSSRNTCHSPGKQMFSIDDLSACGSRPAVLGGLMLVGIVAPALLAVDLYQQPLLIYLTGLEGLLLGCSLSFIYFSSTLMYVVFLGGGSIKNDTERLCLALAVTLSSFAIDLFFSYFFSLSLAAFVTALVLLYVFFIGCFLLAKIKELQA